jgi:Pvc16 N-terminal domain
VFAAPAKTIRQILIKGIPLDLSEVDVSFEAPDREWSGRLSRPTINCFLYDLRENLDLRATDFEQLRNNGKALSTSKRFPARIDATYQITIWARAPEDEHQLLWRTLVVLFRNPVLPEDVLQGTLKNQLFPTPAKVIQPNQARANPAELWQSIDNRIRPALTYTVTVPLDPDISFTDSIVFTRRTRIFGEDLQTPAAEGIHISGRVYTGKNKDTGVPDALVTLKESGASFTTDAEGRFAFRVLAGKSHLSVVTPDGKEISREIEVPSAEYDLQV